MNDIRTLTIHPISLLSLVFLLFFSTMSSAGVRESLTLSNDNDNAMEMKILYDGDDYQITEELLPNGSRRICAENFCLFDNHVYPEEKLSLSESDESFLFLPEITCEDYETNIGGECITEEYPKTMLSQDEDQDSKRLHRYPRLAVMYEAFYALNRRHNGTSSKKLNGWTVSDWNYLNNDRRAYNIMKHEYNNCNYPSQWRWRADRCGDKSMYHNNFYTYPENYGRFGSYGRGGQCKYFANLVVFRSSIYPRRFPVYNDMSRQGKNIRTAKIGDVIFRRHPDHTAIVVRIMRGTPGESVTKVDVVDANYVTWGGRDEEIIGRHILDWNQLKSYKVFNIY